MIELSGGRVSGLHVDFMTIEQKDAIRHMTRTRPKTSSHPEVYALLGLTRRCEANIVDFLSSWGVPVESIQRRMHVTVYYARRLLPGLPKHQPTRDVSIEADVKETRFMVLAPGGENPRPELEPARRSVGIRLTKRNTAVEQIQALRHEMISLETTQVVGQRNPSTAWTSCFGARHYQPHIKLLKPGSEIDRDLTSIGRYFRMCFSTFEFDKYRIVTHTGAMNRGRSRKRR